MNLTYIDQIPGIQNLTDTSAEKHYGGAVGRDCAGCCAETTPYVGANLSSGININTDGDISIIIAIISPGNSEVELNLGDVSLTAGGDINITVIEDSEINIDKAA